ncbi:hypothetical protein CFC21_061504 [Triticum aestivum]|uniref:Uncharacterized protein n=3 Tax=Triticinae TaxID=1648030 RepID=A0A3B6U5A2_WHEAT|nr:hypothetical protein CFC21_061504 [Triticum aestivum]
MEGAGERDEIGHEPHHGGAVQSGGKHKDSTTGDEKDGEFQVQPRWRKFLAHVGSGALVAIGFLDPSNSSVGRLSWDDLCALYTNIIRQPWSENRYLSLNNLSWFLHIKSALIAQSCTGRHLAELCREEYPPFVNICLWIIAELAVISDDIPEVLGTAFAFNILFKIPVWAGVILTVFSTLLLLGVQRFGARKLEFIIAAFMFTMAGCFFGELSYLSPSARDVTKGMFVPSLRGKGAAANAMALFGAIIHRTTCSCTLPWSSHGRPHGQTKASERPADTSS